MDKLALVLALIAAGAGGYAVFELEKDAGPEPASAAALKDLEGTVASLQSSLAAETRAREEAEARVAELETNAASREERLAQVESRKPEPAPPGPLRATELIIESGEGKTVLRLGATKDGAGTVDVFAKNGKRVARLFARGDDDGELALYDENGKLGANLGGNDTGGYGNFYGPGENLAAYIGADSAKPSGYVAVYSTGGKKELAGLYGNEKGGVLSVRNKETDKQVVMIGAAPNNGMGFVGLGTDEGKPALANFVTRNGGQIKTLNADGKAAAFIGVSANPAGNGLLYLCRKDGERIAESGASESGGGYMSFHNSANKRVLFFGASSGDAPDDGVLEVARKNGKLGVVLRAYSGGSSVRVYDSAENVKVNLR